MVEAGAEQKPRMPADRARPMVLPPGLVNAPTASESSGAWRLAGAAVRILAFDTVLDACSAAVWDDTVVAAACEMRRAGHAEALVPMIENVMAEAGCSYADLDVVAVTRGPGSFTGLRIGLAAARAIALAAARPAIGLTSLEVVAAAARSHVRPGEPILVALDARRGAIYAQVFELDGEDVRATSAARRIEAGEATVLLRRAGPVRGGVLVGDAAALVAAAHGDGAFRVAPSPPLPDAAILAALAATRIRLQGLPSGEPPVPLYLRGVGARPLADG